MTDIKEGTTRWRVLRYLDTEGEQSLNAIVLNVEGSAAAIRHAVESLLRIQYLIERKVDGAGSSYTRKIKCNPAITRIPDSQSWRKDSGVNAT